jgi:hypothetical protein
MLAWEITFVNGVFTKRVFELGVLLGERVIRNGLSLLLRCVTGCLVLELLAGLMGSARRGQEKTPEILRPFRGL